MTRGRSPENTEQTEHPLNFSASVKECALAFLSKHYTTDDAMLHTELEMFYFMAH